MEDDERTGPISSPAEAPTAALDGGGTPDTAGSVLGPCRLHPAAILVELVPPLRQLAVPLVVGFFASGGGDWRWLFYLVAIVLTLLGAGAEFLKWRRFRYEVAGGALRVRSGVLARRERAVPLEHIQAVDFEETLVQRLFGVVGVKVETAAGGSAQSDVQLKALSKADAASLRDRLIAARGMVSPVDSDGAPRAAPPVAPATAQLIRRLSPAELLIAGATSGRIGPAMAILVGALQVADDLLPSQAWRRLNIPTPEITVQGVIIVLAVIGLAAWLLAVGSTVLSFGGFELRRDGDRLLISHGLLDRRRTTIPLARIQAVRVSEGLLRQPFGLGAVRIESAGYGKDTAESGVLFPLLRMSELASFLDSACPAFAVDTARTSLTKLPARARRRYVGELAGWVALLTLAATSVTAWTPRAPWWWGLFVLVLLLPAALLGVLRYRDAGWSLDAAERLVLRGRGLGRTTTITARRRLQQRAVNRSFLQRRARLATFHAAVASGGAGGRVALKHLDEAEAFTLLDRLGPRRPYRRAE